MALREFAVLVCEATKLRAGVAGVLLQLQLEVVVVMVAVVTVVTIVAVVVMVMVVVMSFCRMRCDEMWCDVA